MTKPVLTELTLSSAGPDVVSDPATTRASLRASLSATGSAHRQPIGRVWPAASLAHDTVANGGSTTPVDRPETRPSSLQFAAGEVHGDEIYRALSEKLGVAYVRLGEFDVEPAALACLPPEFVRAHHVLPLMFHEGHLVVATDDPADNDKLSTLKFRAQKSIEVVLASTADLDMAIATHYPLIENAALNTETDRILSAQHAQSGAPPAERLAQQKPIVRLVNSLLVNAVQRRASDIHCIPGSASPKYAIE